MSKLFSSEELQEAALLMQQGKLVAFPTETVYGIGTLLHDLDGLHALYQVKGRAYSKPFTAHLYSFDQIAEIVESPSQLFYDLATAFLPGPLTIITKKNKSVPDLAVSGGQNIGIRIPDHALAREFLRLVGRTVVATSANLSHKPPALSATEVLRSFPTSLAAIVDGGFSSIKINSTVVLIDEENRLHLLREGALDKTALEKVSPICYSPK